MRIDDGRNRVYTDNQLAVMNSDVYPVYCKSGAGTAKTEILVQKVITLLKKGVSIEEIFTITFTNKAADEMQARLNDRLYHAWVTAARAGQRDVAKPLRRLVEVSGMFQVSTIHGFCERLLHEYGVRICLPKNYTVSSFRMESREIIDNIITMMNLPATITGVPQHRLAGFIAAILDECGNKGITLSKEYLKKRKTDAWYPTKEIILNLCVQAQEQIEQAKQDSSTMTLNDLMTATIRLLQNEYVLSKITETCKYLFVDEFQDTDKSQFQIVQILMNAGVNVFLIGDDQQSIYAYRGADINSSQKAYETINAIQPNEQGLYENFRSNAVILDKVNKLFNKGFTYEKKKLHFPFVELRFPQGITEKQTNRNPYRVIVGEKTSEIVKGILQFETIGTRSVTHEDINVLCRTNNQVSIIESELRSAGLPVVTVGGKGFYRKKEIIDIYKMFNAILHAGSTYVNEFLFTDYYTAVSANESTTFNDFISELDYVFREESIDGILEYIYDKSGILDFYHHKGDYQASANLVKLKNIAGDILSREYMQPLDFSVFLNKKIETNAEEDEAEIDDNDKKKGVITIMTIHKAKGLSLPVVIVPNVDRSLIHKGRLPDFVIDTEKKHFAINDIFKSGLAVDKEYSKMLNDYIKGILEEEMRVLYVAMTRAEHLLILSTKSNKDKLEYLDAQSDWYSWYKWVSIL